MVKIPSYKHVLKGYKNLKDCVFLLNLTLLGGEPAAKKALMQGKESTCR